MEPDIVGERFQDIGWRASTTEPMRVEGATPFRAMSVGKSGVLAIGRE